MCCRLQVRSRTGLRLAFEMAQYSTFRTHLAIACDTYCRDCIAVARDRVRGWTQAIVQRPPDRIFVASLAD